MGEERRGYIRLPLLLFPFLAGNSNGNSSPSTGGFPVPTRGRIRLPLPDRHVVRVPQSLVESHAFRFGGYRWVDLAIMPCHGIIAR
jgi:hypothetical protein